MEFGWVYHFNPGRKAEEIIENINERFLLFRLINCVLSLKSCFKFDLKNATIFAPT